MIGVLIRENRRRSETQRWSEEGHVRMRQRSEGCCAGPGRPELPEAGRGRDGFFLPAQTLGLAWSCRHLDFGLLASRTMREPFRCFGPTSLWKLPMAALEI